MDISDSEHLDIKNKIFEFPGSIVNHTPHFNFKIIHMLLKINPDFELKTLIDCEQKITINVIPELKEIKLDIAEMKIKKEDVKASFVRIDNVIICEKDDKIIIQFDKLLTPGIIFDLDIKYSTGYFPKDNVIPTALLHNSIFS